MIKKIKNKLKEIENRFRRLDRANEVNAANLDFLKANQQLLFDYSQLSKLFKEEFVPLTRWSISPSTVLHVINDILINNRRQIIEFGCGSSSLYIAKFIKSLDLNVEFFCVESDKEWIEKFKVLAERYELMEYIKFLYVPISTVNHEFSYKDQNKWYDTEILSNALIDKNNFDLVLVDGPWHGTSTYARYSAIPFLEKKLIKNVSVFLDDTYREEELEILNLWKEILQLDMKIYEKYSILYHNPNFIVEPFQLSSWKKLINY